MCLDDSENTEDYVETSLNNFYYSPENRSLFKYLMNSIRIYSMLSNTYYYNIEYYHILNYIYYILNTMLFFQMGR